MSLTRLGPHDMQGGPAGLRWARAANVVKSVGNPAAIMAAPAHAICLWRWPFALAEQDDLIARLDVETFAARTIGPLNGWGRGRDRFYLEGPNEPGRGQTQRLVAFYRRFKVLAAQAGYQVCGFNAATGDYEAEDVERWREADLPLWTAHGYMTRDKGPTEWNAYRMRLFHRDGDPPVIYSEAGFDRCRDGDGGVYLPAGDGPYGWEHQFAGVPDGEEQAATMLESYARGLDRDWEWGGCLYTTSPGPGREWIDKGFDSDTFCDRFAAEYMPWTPTAHQDAPHAPPTPSTPPIVVKPPVVKPPSPASTGKDSSMSDWCPFAVKAELPAGLYSDHRDNGSVPAMICDHIADGNGDPGPYWISLLAGPESKRASAHLWVSKTGLLIQYVRFSAQAWSNGPTCQPDLTNPLIATIVQHGTNPNAATISIEHEGKPGDVMPSAQVAMSRRVHQWLSTTFKIPLDRQYVVGHYQFDRCTRANCPGPSFPWKEIVMPDPVPADLDALRNETYAHAHALRTLKSRWQAAGYPQTAEGLDAAGNAAERFVSTSKGEK